MINVIGLGYIGLPTALMMASYGNEVVGTDYNEELVEKLTNTKPSFIEKGIDELFYKAKECGIKFSTDYQTADTYIVSVPTPHDKKSKKINPAYIVSAIENVMQVCPKGATLIIESTVFPGTIDKYVRPVIELHGFEIGKDIHLVHAPERIIPGNMIYELVHNSRTIGADSKEVGERVKQLYSTFCKGEFVITDIRTAEMTKVIENTFRAVNIAFANELLKICGDDNMDVHEIIRICNMHPRVNILQPGPGVGGHCISVDPWFLVGDYKEKASLINEAMTINESMPVYTLEKILKIMEEQGIDSFKRVGFYGLTYKENVDDVRESPTIQLLREMRSRDMSLNMKIYDPYVKRDLTSCQVHDLDEFLNSVDFVVLFVGHDEIKENIKKLENKIILDTRNICSLDGVYKL